MNIFRAQTARETTVVAVIVVAGVVVVFVLQRFVAMMLLLALFGLASREEVFFGPLHKG